MYAINLKFINDANPGNFITTESKVYRGCWVVLDLVKPVLRFYFYIIFLVTYYLTHTIPDFENLSEQEKETTQLVNNTNTS